MDAISATSSLSTSSMQMMGDMAVNRAQAISMRGSVRSMAQIDKASKDFEGMFMSQMLSPMFEGISTEGSFDGGHGEEVMRSLLVQEYGKIASKRGGLGIADHVKREMIKAQNIAQGKSPDAGLSTPTPTPTTSAAAAAAYTTPQITSDITGGTHAIIQ